MHTTSKFAFHMKFKGNNSCIYSYRCLIKEDYTYLLLFWHVVYIQINQIQNNGYMIGTQSLFVIFIKFWPGGGNSNQNNSIVSTLTFQFFFSFRINTYWCFICRNITKSLILEFFPPLLLCAKIFYSQYGSSYRLG